MKVMIVDQSGSHQLMGNRPKGKVEGDGKKSRKHTDKGLQY